MRNETDSNGKSVDNVLSQEARERKQAERKKLTLRPLTELNLIEDFLTMSALTSRAVISLISNQTKTAALRMLNLCRGGCAFTTRRLMPVVLPAGWSIVR